MPAFLSFHPQSHALASPRKTRPAVVASRLRASLVLKRVARPSRRVQELRPADAGAMGLTVSLVPIAAGAPRLSTVPARASLPCGLAGSRHARAAV